MKPHILKKVSLLAVILVFAVSACEDFMDVHKKYIEGGEIVYSPKVEDLEFRAGENRIYFKTWLRNSPNVKTVNVYWNNRQDSIIIPVTPSLGLDSAEVFIPNLEEKSYTFEVRTTDNYGHHSLMTSGTGTVYGSIFQSTLANRPVDEFIVSNGEARITWLSAVETSIRSELRYKNDAGEIKVVNAFPGESSTVCDDINPSSTYEYRTLFLPEPEAVDTFYTDWTSIYPVALFDKTNWIITASSDAEGWIAGYAIDNNPNTGWHCSWASPAPTFPHWLEIDMQAEKQIKSIEIYKRRDTKTISLELSSDGTNWTEMGTIEFPESNDITRELSFDNVLARYIRITFIDGYNGSNVSLWEVSVFGDLSE